MRGMRRLAANLCPAGRASLRVGRPLRGVCTGRGEMRFFGPPVGREEKS